MNEYVSQDKLRWVKTGIKCVNTLLEENLWVLMRNSTEIVLENLQAERFSGNKHFQVKFYPKCSEMSEPHCSLLSLHCSLRSPGVWQRTPALPKWWRVCQQRPLQLSLSLHRPALWEAPVRVGAGGMHGTRLGSGLPDTSMLPQAAAAAAASGLGIAERALERLVTWWQWYTNRRLHLNPPTLPFQINYNH